MTRYRLHVEGQPPPIQIVGDRWSVGVTTWPNLDTFGICSHHFGQGEYADVDGWTQKIADLGIWGFRSGAFAHLDQVQRAADRARELGLKWLGMVANEDITEQQLRANIAFVKANLDIFIGAEGINEPGHGDIAKTVRFQNIIFDELGGMLPVLSPALRRPATRELYQQFADAGILGKYHKVSLHHYLPEEFTEHVDMVQEVWRCDRFWVTETGRTTATESTDPRRATEQEAADAFMPQLLGFLADPRVERVFHYELLDKKGAPLTDNEAYFGVFRGDGSPKPVVDEILRFTGPST